MEINITSLLETDLFAFSHSAHEGGENAGRNTWNAAKDEAATAPLLQTPEQLDAMRGWAKRSGGWNKEEIAAWDDCELNALFLQLIAGDVREAGWDCLDSEVWMKDGDLMDSMTGERAENCLIFKTESGEIFYYLGE
jgi:hypothetical protein